MSQSFVDEQQTGYSPLSQFALLRVSGPDSERFLQGQLTCDVVKLSANGWTPGACCTAKGRMVANFIIARDPDDGYWLRLPADQLEALSQHLQKYAVFFKTELKDSRDSYQVIGRIPVLPATLQTIDSIEMAATRTIKWQPHGAELSYADGRKELWLTTEVAQQQLADVDLCDELRWHQFDIFAGTSWVTSASREHWIPQNIDWHLQGGVSFNKGCYTGQETVARLQYLGKANKSLYLLKSDQPHQLPPRTAVKTTSGKSRGELTGWAGNIGLALLNEQGSDQPTVLITESSEIPVSIEKLSYTQEQENNTGD